MSISTQCSHHLWPCDLDWWDSVRHYVIPRGVAFLHSNGALCVCTHPCSFAYTYVHAMWVCMCLCVLDMCFIHTLSVICLLHHPLCRCLASSKCAFATPLAGKLLAQAHHIQLSFQTVCVCVCVCLARVGLLINIPVSTWVLCSAPQSALWLIQSKMLKFTCFAPVTFTIDTLVRQCETLCHP